MKRLLVGDHRQELVSALETILRHWGYRVVASTGAEQLCDLIRETGPDLIIMGSRLLVGQGPALRDAVRQKVCEESLPLILLGEGDQLQTLDMPHETLEIPLDVFSLFALIQRHVERHPRKNLRLTVKLPGMFCRGETCTLAEVLTLSTEGLFIRTGARLEERDEVRVFFPLMGMKQELELDGRVLYRVEPGPENKYMQGVGIEFAELAGASDRLLRSFIERCFLGELSTHRHGDEQMAKNQLRNISPEITLELRRA